jgi:L-iditol 2-dehydrogenase
MYYKSKKIEIIYPKKFEEKVDIITGIKSDEVLVKVIYSGICGSDLHAYLGENKFVKFPSVLGHEFIGEVVEVGKDVLNAELGDIITSEPITVCGRCEYCKNEKYNLCKQLTFIDGTFREYLTVSNRFLYKIPNDLSKTIACLIEPLSVAVHALKIAKLKKGDSVFIYGSGTIGQLLVLALKDYGIENIYAADLSEMKLRLAKKNGAKETILVNKDNNNLIKELEGNFDLVFDCVSNTETINNSIDLLKNGSSLVVIGLPVKRIEIDLDIVLIKEIKLLGSFIYNNNDFLDSIRIIKENASRAKYLISKIFRLSHISKGFEEIIRNNSRYIKCLISCNTNS